MPLQVVTRSEASTMLAQQISISPDRPVRGVRLSAGSLYTVQGLGGFIGASATGMVRRINFEAISRTLV